MGFPHPEPQQRTHDRLPGAYVGSDSPASPNDSKWYSGVRDGVAPWPEPPPGEYQVEVRNKGSGSASFTLEIVYEDMRVVYTMDLGPGQSFSTYFRVVEGSFF